MKGLKLLSSEITLGTLVAILSVLAAVSGYQSSMADSDQTKNNVLGQKMLTDANAEYLSANQMIVYDYQMYDGYYMGSSRRAPAGDALVERARVAAPRGELGRRVPAHLVAVHADSDDRPPGLERARDRADVLGGAAHRAGNDGGIALERRVAPHVEHLRRGKGLAQRAKRADRHRAGVRRGFAVDRIHGSRLHCGPAGP